jgi:hypothetical protein
MQAIDMCINRFDEDTKTSFRDLYTKIDEEVNANDDTVAEPSFDNEVGF